MLSNFKHLRLFTLYLTDYNILNNLLESTQYFSSILELAPYIINCLNTNKKDLEALYKLLESKISIYKECVTHGDTVSQLNHDSYKELHSYFKKLKKYCSSYKSTSTKSLEPDADLFFILNEIVEIGAESYEFAYKDLQFCEFKITELIRNNLHDISKSNDNFKAPLEYQKLIKPFKKEVKK